LPEAIRYPHCRSYRDRLTYQDFLIIALDSLDATHGRNRHENLSGLADLESAVHNG
jgi:hypothetical protein